MKTYTRRRSSGNGGNPSIVSLDEVCRLCLAREDRLVPIFGQDEPVPLALRIMACVALEVVEDDGLPGMICRPCHYQLEKYYIFRKKCENSDLKLRMHLKQITESSSVIFGGGVNVDDEDKMEQPVSEQALVGASVTIAIPEEGEGDLELDGQIHEMEDTNDITLPQDTPDDPRQACTLNRDLPMIDGKDVIDIPLDDKDDDGNARGDDFKPRIENAFAIKSDNVQNVSKDEGMEAQIVSNDPNVLSMRVFPSTEGALTHVEVTTQDGSVLVMELTTEETPEPERSETGELLLFKCDHCPKSFSRPGALKRHSSIHNTQRGFTCNICEKWFPSHSSYIRHERIHTGEKPFQCGICQRCFAQKDILLRHLLTHSDVKPFNCSTCNKGFTQRDALKTHMLSHMKDHKSAPLHKCTFCAKAFCHASGLSRHLSTHTGRKYLCGECHKIFNDRSSLKRHVKVSGHRSS